MVSCDFYCFLQFTKQIKPNREGRKLIEFSKTKGGFVTKCAKNSSRRVKATFHPPVHVTRITWRKFTPPFFSSTDASHKSPGWDYSSKLKSDVCCELIVLCHQKTTWPLPARCTLAVCLVTLTTPVRRAIFPHYWDKSPSLLLPVEWFSGQGDGNKDSSVQNLTSQRCRPRSWVSIYPGKNSCDVHTSLSMTFSSGLAFISVAGML